MVNFIILNFTQCVAFSRRVNLLVMTSWKCGHDSQVQGMTHGVTTSGEGHNKCKLQLPHTTHKRSVKKSGKKMNRPTTGHGTLPVDLHRDNFAAGVVTILLVSNPGEGVTWWRLSTGTWIG